MKTQREKLQWIPTTRLLTLKRNPQYLTPKQMDSLKASIKRDGFVAPILVRAIGRTDNFEVVSGNHRLMAARELKREAVPCVVVKMSDRAAKRLAVNLNLIHGDPPAELLAPFLAELDDATLKEIHLEGNLLREVMAFDDDLAKTIKNLNRPMESINTKDSPLQYPTCKCKKCGRQHVPLKTIDPLEPETKPRSKK